MLRILYEFWCERIELKGVSNLHVFEFVSYNYIVRHEKDLFRQWVISGY